jgi:WD40 repeat protein/DNA-binding SARP family transcriptional activator
MKQEAAMAHLDLSFLGRFQATVDARPVTGFESNKVRALLAFLAVESARPHARETLAGLLWPDYPDHSALSNLRSALANLRSAIDDHRAVPPFLLITRDAIRFNPDSDYALDLNTLRDTQRASTEELARAAAAYQGEFLEGFSLADSPAFEQWVLVQRAQVQQQALMILRRLAERYLVEGRAPDAADQALATARHALAIEPWDEEAHRLAMRALALSGQRGLALAQFEACRRLLQDELRVEPDAATVALAEQIRRSELGSAPGAQPGGFAASHPGARSAAEGQPVAQLPPEPGEPPFKGLACFDEADAELFFGREALTATLADQVRGFLAPGFSGPRFLAVIGASGSGKSSVVRAGLVPALRRLNDPDAPGDPRTGDAVLVITPTGRPLEALALALTATSPGVGGAAALADDMVSDPRALRLAARRRLAQLGDGDAHLTLVVDQFEELFTLCRDETERRAFVDNLLGAAVAGGPATVLIVLRADFYAWCAPYRSLREALEQGQRYIGAMGSEELVTAIEEPARRGGWLLEPGLAPMLLREAGDAPGALPLLSHALLETWRRRSGRTMTVTGYQAAGGVSGAIARSAEATWQALSPQQQLIARAIFLRLVALPGGADGDGAPELYARRRAALEELIGGRSDPAEVHAVLAVLAGARLVTTGQETVELAHEALIAEWSRLREWLDENRAGLRLQRQLTEAAQEWERLGRDPGLLFRGARLALGLEWAAAGDAALNLQERLFLEASDAASRAEQATEAERCRREAEASQLLAEEQRLRAEAEAQKAEEQQLRAEAERSRAESQTRSAARLRRLAAGLAVAAAGLVLLAAAALWLARSRQEQAQLARSRELAAAAVSAAQTDPERSVLLGLEAVEASDTLEARNALHRALPELHSVRTIAAHGPGGAPGVAYSPDGARLISIGQEGEARIWDAATGELLLTLSGAPETAGMDVAWSPDGRRAAGTWLGQAVVWDATTGAVLARMPGEGAGQVNRVAFSPDSRLVAVAKSDGVPKVWELLPEADGGLQVAERLALAGHGAPTEAVAFSPDGRRLATGDVAGEVKVWDAVTGRELLNLTHGGIVHGLAFSPDGTRLAAAGEDGRLLIWESATGQFLLSLPGRSGLYEAAYTPDGERIVTVHQDGSAWVWDADTGQPLLSLAGHASTAIGVAASPDNIHVATSGYDSTVRVWDTRPGRELLTLQAHDAPAYAVAYAPDGTRLATAGGDGMARLWNPDTGLLALSLMVRAGAPGYTSIAFSPDGTRIAAGAAGGAVVVGDAATGRTLRELPAHGDMVWGLAFSPDGDRLASTSWDGTARVSEVATGREVATFAGHQGAMVFGAVFSPDGKLVYTAGERSVREWDPETGRELRTFSGDGQDVYAVAVDPAGQILAMGRQDGSIILWNLAAGNELRRLTGHGGLVNRLAFSGDGERLASASFDKYAKLWDVESGRELATFTGNGGNVFGVALSPDGRRLATSGGDGTARIYTLDLAELAVIARSRVSRELTAEECRRYLHLAACP